MLSKEENEIQTKSNKILIVEDEARLLSYLTELLSGEGFETIQCSSFFELETLVEIPINTFDIIILDRLLQGKDSATLLSKIKYGFSDSKIIVLSAINTPSEKATLLDHGADDYLAKPFDGEELVARIRALLRRSYRLIKLGNVSLNSIGRTMTIKNQEVSLTNKEFALLMTFVQYPGKLFNKSFLNQNVWEMSTDVDSNVVETTVAKLRKKLLDSEATIKIRNIRNRGYWIEE